MTLRALLPALLGGLLLAPTVGAQSAQRAGTVRDASVTDLAAPAPASGVAPADGLLAACATGETATQAFVTGATFIVSVGDTANGGAPQELGQSFTAPCDGLLSTLTVIGQSTVASQPVTLTLSLFDGMGTGGTLLRSATSNYTLPTVGGYNLGFTFAPVAVAQGQVITLFVDASSPSTFYQQIVDPGTYAGGTAYLSTTGTAAGATVEGSGVSDIRFTATFGPATSVTASGFYNPSPAAGDGAGWRLLSSPVGGVSLTTLASKNLVQGVPAGANPTTNPAQYPLATPNLLIAYSSTSGFLGADAGGGTDFVPRVGTGYFWYFYDQAITPPANTSGGGTSTSRELTGFTLSATGVAPAANVSTPYYFAVTNGAYMLGNPFARPFQLSGLTKTAGDGTLGTVFSVFDPSVGVSGSYVTLAPATYVAPWQGFFANVAGSTTTPTFAYAYASTSTAVTPTFYGRSAGLADVGVQVRLDGVTAAGPVGDRATQVRFLPDALIGMDRHDGTKLLPPGDTYALLAPVASADGEARRLSVHSLPDALDAATVPLAFVATHAGTFTLTWDVLVDGQTATLRDLVTGAVVDLVATAGYTFTADATDWTDRFELVLASRSVASESGPATVALSAVVPNPTAGTASLTLRVDAAQTVRATVVDALGRQVATLYEGEVAPSADVTLSLDTARLAPGVYSVRVQGATFVETRQVTVAR